MLADTYGQRDRQTDRQKVVDERGKPGRLARSRETTRSELFQQ